MRQLRLRASIREFVAEDALRCAYIAGMDGVPTICQRQWDGQDLVITRRESESGNVFIPCLVPGYGELMLSTASLMDRPEPYDLLVELARGTLNRLRNQLADLKQLGVEVSTELYERSRAATRQLRGLMLTPDGQVDHRLALVTIQEGVHLLQKLGNEQSQRLLAERHQRESKLPTLLGGCLNGSLTESQLSAFPGTFNAGVLAVNWPQVQVAREQWEWNELDQHVNWCHQHGLLVVMGPLVTLEQTRLPAWVLSQQEDAHQVISAATEFVQELVQRYRGRVHLWHVAAGLNLPGALWLNEESRLQMAATLVEATGKSDEQTPRVISFDQPWGEYLANHDYELSPLHFADALLRANLGLAGIGIDVNFGYWPRGTFPRDWIEVSRQLDRWSMLGAPLLVSLTIPSAGEVDAGEAARPVTHGIGGVPSRESQATEAEQLIELMLSKPSIHGIVWGQLTDQMSRGFAHAGLWDHQGEAKPVLEVLKRIRLEHLK